MTKIDNAILYRFLNRETTEEENRKIFKWVSASQANREEFRKIHHSFHLSNLKKIQSEIDIDKAWEKLSGDIKQGEIHKEIINLDIILKIAASVLILIAVGFGSIWTNEHFFSREKSAIVHFEAPSGEKSKIQLADGSDVWLNSETTLKYDISNPRSVTVAGEAFFDIVKDAGHPFLVNTTSGIKVKVTGTRFNLRCYKEETVVETTLEEGKVTIMGNKGNRMASLKPGQQAKYKIGNKKVDISNVTPELYSLWKNNEIRFSDIPFRDLIPQVERWYGISIELDPGISKKDRFTMTIKTESLRELLNMMKLTSKFDYEIDGSSVKINSK